MQFGTRFVGTLFAASCVLFSAMFGWAYCDQDCLEVACWRNNNPNSCFKVTGGFYCEKNMWVSGGNADEVCVQDTMQVSDLFVCSNCNDSCPGKAFTKATGCADCTFVMQIYDTDCVIVQGGGGS